MNKEYQLPPEIKYPYLPEGRKILYVPVDHEFMSQAVALCQKSGCAKQPTGAVIVKDGQIIGRGTNAGRLMPECARWGSPTGTNYGPCKEICHQEGHAEVMAIKDANTKQLDCQGADLYLYGHWWCCQTCWQAIMTAGIKDVYLADKSCELFNPEMNPAIKDWGRPKNV